MHSSKKGHSRRAYQPGQQGWVIPAVTWWVIAVFLVFAVLYPLLMLVFTSVRTESGAFTTANYIRVFSDPAIRNSMANSLKVVLPSTVFSTLLGVFIAWAVARTNMPGRRLLKTLLQIPYFIPPFIGAISWTFLLGPKGFFNEVLMKFFRLSSAPFNIYSIGGMIFVMTIYRFAVPFIVVLPTMQKISASVEEAARGAGAKPMRVLRDITLPLLGPSILGASLLVFMFLLSDFGVSAILGAPNRIHVMTTEIYYIINRPDMENNLQIAAAYSILLSAFALIGLVLYNRILSNNKYAVISGKSEAAAPMHLGRGTRWGLTFVLTLIFIITTLAPVLAAVITSVTKVYGVPFSVSNATLANFTKLASIRNVSRAFRNSFLLAFAAGLVIMFVTLVISYIGIRQNVRGVAFVRSMQVLVTLPYALPGTIIALSMILAFNQPLPVVGWRLYRTFWILLVAYIARFLNLGYNNITGAISQIDPSLEEAARASGASPIRTFLDIVMPLLRSSLLTSFFLVAAPAISEISLSTLLASTKNETIGTIVYAAQEEGKILRVAAMAVLLMVLVVIINFIANHIGKWTDACRLRRRKKAKISNGKTDD